MKESSVLFTGATYKLAVAQCLIHVLISDILDQFVIPLPATAVDIRPVVAVFGSNDMWINVGRHRRGVLTRVKLEHRRMLLSLRATIL